MVKCDFPFFLIVLMKESIPCVRASLHHEKGSVANLLHFVHYEFQNSMVAPQPVMPNCFDSSFPHDGRTKQDAEACADAVLKNR